MPTRKTEDAPQDEPPAPSPAPAAPTDGTETEDATEPDLGGQLSQQHAFDLGLDLNALLAEEAQPTALCPSPTVPRMQDAKRIFGNASSYSLDEYLHIKQSALE